MTYSEHRHLVEKVDDDRERLRFTLFVLRQELHSFANSTVKDEQHHLPGTRTTSVLQSRDARANTDYHSQPASTWGAGEECRTAAFPSPFRQRPQNVCAASPTGDSELRLLKVDSVHSRVFKFL